MNTVYLVGQINNQSLDNCINWRKEVEFIFQCGGMRVINPMKWANNGIKCDIKEGKLIDSPEHSGLIVGMSEWAVSQSDVLFAKLSNDGGWGTPMEICQARREYSLPVIGWGLDPDGDVNGWILEYVSYFCMDMEEAADKVITLLGK